MLQQGCDVGMLFVKPILVLSCRGSQTLHNCVIHRLAERGARCFDVLLVQSDGTKPFFQGINKHLLGGAVFQLGDVNSLWRLLAWRSSLGLHADVELGHDETVVCPTFCTAHGLGDPHILPVPLPDDDIVYQMPML